MLPEADAFSACCGGDASEEEESSSAENDSSASTTFLDRSGRLISRCWRAFRRARFSAMLSFLRRVAAAKRVEETAVAEEPTTVKGWTTKPLDIPINNEVRMLNENKERFDCIVGKVWFGLLVVAAFGHQRVL